MKTNLILIFLTVIFSCKSNNPLNAQSENNALPEQALEEIPQGIFTYEIYFAEFGGRMPNRSCTVEINGNNIIVSQNENTGLTGDEIIFEGLLLKHKSGIWILAESEADIMVDDIGGCTNVPTIDFEKKLIEWC